MLFDDEEQLEVRHVISLAHHDISIYSGGDVTPEGELFIKRNALCLTRRVSESEKTPDAQVSKPFYLFSENCSAKEDFYFSLLKNQEQTFTFPGRAPKPKHFDIKNIISLVQKLHSSEDNIHSRWVNAMMGRIFLGVYQTRDIESFINEKITKKISRVKKPSFLTNIVIRRIDTGEAAPYFSNLKLRDLTVEGECVVEADVKYMGNFRIEVAATAKIDLGTRFKAREVNLVLSVMLKRIEGHVLFKVKPPPSNRMWFSFQTMPKMEMTIEPIVSARQITYTVILRQIENRIKEVMAETLVQPFWDDMPFFKTEHKRWRGGIFEGDDAVETADGIVEPEPTPTEDTATLDTKADAAELASQTRPLEKSQTMPVIEQQPAPTGLFGRRLATKSGTSSAASASSTNLDVKGSAATSSRSPNIIKNSSAPIVSTETTHADIFKPSTSPPDQATNYIAALHSRTQDMSPAPTPVGSPEKPGLARIVNHASESSGDGEGSDDPDVLQSRRNTVSSIGSGSIDGAIPQSPNTSTIGSFQSQAESLGRKFFTRRDSNASVTTTSSGNGEQKRNTLAAVSNVALQARQWGWNAIQKQKEARRAAESGSQVDLTQPMGRGQPLPPPGTPLPGPTNGKTKLNPVPTPKRKPVPPPLPEQPTEEAKEDREHRQASGATQRGRRRGASYEQDEPDEPQILVVGIPDDSQPGTPATEEKPDILGPAESEESNKVQADETSSSDAGVAEHPAVVEAKSADSSEEEAHATSNEQDAGAITPESDDLATEDGPIVAMPAAEDPADDDFSPWLEDDEGQMDNDIPKEVLPTPVAGEVKT